MKQTTIDIEDLEPNAKTISPNAVVKQSNEIINGKWRMNLNQSRIFLTAVSMIEDEDQDFQGYRIQAHQLKEMLNLKGKSIYDQLKRDVPRMMKTFIEVNHGKHTEWISIVSSAKYMHSEGDLIIKFSPDMRPYLLNIKEKFTQYTQFKLIDALNFKSMYALRLFLLLKQFDRTGWRHITLHDLRETLDLNATKTNDIKEDLYPLTADLKRRVVDPACRELNKFGFRVDYKVIKDGRKITAFKFAWRAETKEEIVELKPASEKAERLSKRLINLGLSTVQVKKIGAFIGNKTIPTKELYQCLFSIEGYINDKEIPRSKWGGVVYKSLSRTFDLGNW